MANRPAFATQAETARFMKAARSAGFGKVRLVKHTDGRSEWIAEAVSGETKNEKNDFDEVLED